jgi:prenylcysteine oxidase/farnesylcysteine lyase
MGGEEMYRLTQITAEQYMLRDLGLQETLTRELITGAMYMNYGQGIGVNAFTCMVSLAGVQENSLWSVVGGNRRIPETALERSGATLHGSSVTSVTRIEREGAVSYSVETGEGGSQGEYDAVIVATPLYEKSIQFMNFPAPIYTEDITSTAYHRTVAEFIDGEINPAFFGLDDNDGSFPLYSLTTDSAQELSPFPFCSVGVDVPSEEPESANAMYTKPLTEDRSRVWKVFTPRPLTSKEKIQMFKKIDAEATVDWLAYPNYSPPESFPPFELDQGLFYVNGIEKAASAMEMSAVGAMNCALLVRDYLRNRADD